MNVIAKLINVEFQKQPNSYQGNKVQCQSHLQKEKSVNKLVPFRMTDSKAVEDTKVERALKEMDSQSD